MPPNIFFELLIMTNVLIVRKTSIYPHLHYFTVILLLIVTHTVFAISDIYSP